MSREGRYVMKYSLVAVISIWRPPTANMEKTEVLSSFIHAFCCYCNVLSKSQKSDNVINSIMESQILKLQMSKTFTLAVYSRRTIPSD